MAVGSRLRRQKTRIPHLGCGEKTLVLLRKIVNKLNFAYKTSVKPAKTIVKPIAAYGFGV